MIVPPAYDGRVRVETVSPHCAAVEDWDTILVGLGDCDTIVPIALDVELPELCVVENWLVAEHAVAFKVMGVR